MAGTDAASRVIAAPPDRVYAALVDQDALLAWLPPDGMTGRFERFDARPGGCYRMVLTYANASSAPGKASADSDIVEARFIDIVPGARVVQAVDFVSDEPAYAGTMTSPADGACYRAQPACCSDRRIARVGFGSARSRRSRSEFARRDRWVYRLRCRRHVEIAAAVGSSSRQPRVHDVARGSAHMRESR